MIETLTKTIKEIEMKEFYVFEAYPGKKYLLAEELEAASVEDIIEAGYSLDDWGLTENDTETGGFSCRWWDGNNWQVIVLDSDDLNSLDSINAEVEELETPDPAFDFYYNLVLANGEKIKVSQSNCSGSVSPFYFECK